jgi:hypothetical protein
MDLASPIACVNVVRWRLKLFPVSRYAIVAYALGLMLRAVIE